MEKIGILTGGGDCPGLNAVIPAVVRHAVDPEAIPPPPVEQISRG